MKEPIVINAETREITVPEKERAFGVAGERKVEVKHIRIEGRTVDGTDLTQGFSWKVSCENAGKELCADLIDGIVADAGNIEFDWIVGAAPMAYKGTLHFAVCAVRVDAAGNILQEWHSKLCTGDVASGIEATVQNIGGQDLLAHIQSITAAAQRNAAAVQALAAEVATNARIVQENKGAIQNANENIEAIKAASANAKAAATSEDNARISAAAAAVSEGNAAASADKAKASETAAAESASNAAKDAAKAASAAKKAADESVAANIAAIERMQDDVASMQTAAAASESAASDSAAAAAQSKANAAASASAASGDAANAKKSATSAATSEKNASASEATASEAAQRAAEVKASIPETYDELSRAIVEIKKSIPKKLDTPANPVVGQLLRIKTVNEDGSVVLESVENTGGFTDVTVNGVSIVEEDVARVPLASIASPGVVQLGNSSDLVGRADNKAVRPSDIDSVAKLALCDGKGAAWTNAEKTGAWSRLNTIKDVIDSVAIAGCTYLLGEQTYVNITLPSDALPGQKITIVFSSGATACTLVVDADNFDFVPKAGATNFITFLCIATDKWLADAREG